MSGINMLKYVDLDVLRNPEKKIDNGPNVKDIKLKQSYDNMQYKFNLQKDANSLDFETRKYAEFEKQSNEKLKDLEDKKNAIGNNAAKIDSEIKSLNNAIDNIKTQIDVAKELGQDDKVSQLESKLEDFQNKLDEKEKEFAENFVESDNVDLEIEHEKLYKAELQNMRETLTRSYREAQDERIRNEGFGYGPREF